MADAGTVAARLMVEVGARGITETAAGLGQMSGAVDRTSMGIGGLVRAAGGIYAVKKGFDATIGSAIAWESEFAGVEKTVEGTEAELSALEGTLLGMHRTMPIARADLAGIAEAAGALGIATGSIDEFTETVAMIGETTNVSSEQAANALGKLSNVLGLTEDDFDNFGAALVDLGNKGASTEDEILGIAERAGAGASLIDIAADATLGWSAAVANLGIEAEAGGSALQRFFLGMTEHVSAAGEELDAIAETAGMTGAEFQRAFNDDASAALQTFIGGMEDLTQAERLALLELLGFNDVRISRTLLGLAGNVDNLNDSLVIGSEAWDENTALLTEYGKRADTTASKIEVLGNRLGDLGRRAGESAPVDIVIGGADASITGWEKAFTWLDLAFGENNARMQDWARETGNTVDSIFYEIEDLMNTGLTFDEAFERATTGVIDIMDEGARQAVAAWKQHDLGGEIVGNLNKVDDLFSRGGLDIAGPITEEMEAARAAAVAGAQGIVDGIAGLFETETAATDAATAFVESLADPFTDVDQIEAIISNLLLNELPEAFADGSTVTSQKSLEWVNDQLEIFDTLNPGMLERGRDGGTGLLEGMQELDEPLQTYAETLAGDLLDHMTLADAMRELGYDGLAEYFDGMESAEGDNDHVAGAIATRAVNALTIDASSGGYSIVQSWIDGMGWAYQNNQGRVWGIVDGVKRAFGGSLPTEGPLAGGAGSGGQSIAESWIDALVGGVQSGLADVHGAIGGVGDALGASLGGPSVDVGASRGGGSGGGEVHYHGPTVYLTVEGPLEVKDEESLVGTLQRALSMGDVRVTAG